MKITAYSDHHKGDNMRMTITMPVRLLLFAAFIFGLSKPLQAAPPPYLRIMDPSKYSDSDIMAYNTARDYAVKVILSDGRLTDYNIDQ
jgi:hypothetical protein